MTPQSKFLSLFAFYGHTRSQDFVGFYLGAYRDFFPWDCERHPIVRAQHVGPARNEKFSPWQQ